MRTLILQPDDAIDYQAADWVGAIVVVERGSLELECRSGARAAFEAGAVLVFIGVEPRRLRNAGTTALLLTALSR